MIRKDKGDEKNKKEIGCQFLYAKDDCELLSQSRMKIDFHHKANGEGESEPPLKFIL